MFEPLTEAHRKSFDLYVGTANLRQIFHMAKYFRQKKASQGPSQGLTHMRSLS